MAEHYLLTKACRDFSRSELSKLSDEEATRFLSKLRWGFEDRQICPSCGELAAHYVRRQRKQWRCRSCARDFSITSGTPFSHHKIPIQSILEALYSFVLPAKGVPALQVSRETGHRWRTAWLLFMKARETLLKNRHIEPLKGVVQMDGGYFGGKRRDANFHGRRTDDAAYKEIAQKIEGAPTQRSRRRKQFVPGGAANAKRRKNRRLVFVIRELYPEPGRGARRTIISVAKSENEEDAVAMARKYIQPGSIVMTDEGNAFSQFSQWFDHHTVPHAQMYRTPEGVDDNQAESYYSRLRRAEYGVFHRFTPLYLADYANEFAWREDTRRDSMREKFENLIQQILKSGRSRFFGGYFQGNRRTVEILNI